MKLFPLVFISLFFFIILFFPSILQPVKLVFLSIVFIYIVIKIMLRPFSFSIDSNLFFLFAINFFCNLCFIIFGVVNQTPGAVRVSTIYLAYPIIFLLLIGSSNSTRNFDYISNTLLISGLLISLYSILVILYFSGVIPFYIDLNLEQTFVMYSGQPEFRILSLSSLIYTTPYTLSFLILNPIDSYIKKILLYIVLTFQVIIVVLSGRRALLLVVVIAGIIAFIKKIRDGNIKIKPIIISLAISFGFFILLLSYFEIDILIVIDDFVRGFDFESSSEGPYERKKQFDVLINGWSKNPLFGYGHGAAATYRRSDEFPWAYELSYIALLYQIGLIGLIINAISYSWVVYKLIKLSTIYEGSLKKYIFPTIIATVCFLIANSTNPYLTKFDYIWVIFLPIALLNTILYKINNGQNT